MLGLELVVALGVAILACSLGAQRLRIAPPLLLLAGGAALGFIPAFRQVVLPSEVVLLLFLPALLYWESLPTSLGAGLGVGRRRGPDRGLRGGGPRPEPASPQRHRAAC